MLHYFLWQAFASKIDFTKYSSYSIFKVQAERMIRDAKAILLMELLIVNSKVAFRNIMMTIKRSLKLMKSISNNPYLSFLQDSEEAWKT